MKDPLLTFVKYLAGGLIVGVILVCFITLAANASGGTIVIRTPSGGTQICTTTTTSSGTVVYCP